MTKNHRIQYLQSALSDLGDIVIYVREQLDAPQAATNLVDRLDTAISRLECFPFSGHPYSLTRQYFLSFEADGKVSTRLGFQTADPDENACE